MDSGEETIKPKDDGTLAITILVVIILSLMILLYYLWKFRQIFGFEDKRFSE